MVGRSWIRACICLALILGTALVACDDGQASEAFDGGTDGSSGMMDGGLSDGSMDTSNVDGGVNDGGAGDAAPDSGDLDLNGCSGVSVPDSYFDKAVTLTFDDGPVAATTPAILDILAAHSIKATFFINGERVKDKTARDIVWRIKNEGHILANHSHTHANFKQISPQEVMKEIEETDKILREFDVIPRYFRFPYGAANCQTAMAVAERGYAIVGWNIDSADWCFASKTDGVGYCSPKTFKYVPDAYRSDLEGFTLAQAQASKGGIILFHDIHQNTVDVLNNTIVMLKNEGFHFTNLDDEAVYPLLNGLSQPFIGQPCAEDSDCGFGALDQRGYCQRYGEYGFCSLACEGICPDREGWSETFCAPYEGAGICVVESTVDNMMCQIIPGAIAINTSRYIGTSGASPRMATVCMPSS